MEIKKEVEIINKIGEDKSQFKQLYKEYSEDVYRYLYSINSNRETAEDLVSQTFLVALEKIETYQPRGISIKYWLISIARNLSLDSFRKNKWLNDAYEVSEEIDLDRSKPIQSDHNLNIDVAKYLSLLPVQTREIIILKIWEEYTFKEIGELINESENTVKTQFYRGLEKIKQDMDKEGFSKGFALFPIIWSQIDSSKGQYKFSGEFNMDNIQDLGGPSVSSSSNFLKYFAITSGVLVTSLLFTALVFVLFENNDEEPKQETNAVSETDDSQQDSEDVDDEEEVKEPVVQDPVVYEYSFDMDQYSAPGGGPLDSVGTILFTSKLKDLEVIEVGSPENGNLNNGLVGLTIVGNDQVQIRFDQYYEGFNMSFGPMDFESLSSNPVIEGNIGRFTQDGWHRYVSNVSLVEGCFGVVANEYPAPCGLPIVSFVSSDSLFVGISCKNDLSGEICKEMIANIKGFTQSDAQSD